MLLLLTDLIGNQDAAEGQDLDYQQAHYGSEEKASEELANHVVAFANHTSGLFIWAWPSKGIPRTPQSRDASTGSARRSRSGSVAVFVVVRCSFQWWRAW